VNSQETDQSRKRAGLGFQPREPKPCRTVPGWLKSCPNEILEVPLFILLLSIFLSDQFSQETVVPIQSGGFFFDGLERSEIQFDGSIIIPNFHQVFHFSQTGELIRKFGSKGNGPGEFVLAYEAFWDGEYYTVMDNRTGEFSFFSADGFFIKRDPGNVRHLFFFGDKRLMVNSQQISSDKPAICLVQLSEDATVVAVGDYFHEVIPEIKGLQYNFSNIFATPFQGDLYVMDQLSNKVTRYDKDLAKKSSFTAQLKYYADPPKIWPDISGRPNIRRFCYSFPWIQRLGSIKEGLVIGYFLPNPEDPNGQLKYLTVVDSNGKTLVKEPLKIEGHFIGTFNDLIYVVEESEDLDYTLKVIKFGASP